MIVKLKDFYCEILGFLLEILDFVCIFNSEYDDFFFNKILSNENGENRLCFGNLILMCFKLKVLDCLVINEWIFYYL